MYTANLSVMPKSTVDNVVQNDKPTTAAPTESAVAVLAVLEQQRISWEEGAYRTSNQALYAILSQCLQFGDELNTTEANKIRREALQAFYQQRGYRWKKETPLFTKIVRAVFGDIDRRRISTYSLVMRQAKKEAVLPSKFADWVERNGGVQEVRLAQSETFVSPKAKAQTAQGRFEQMNKLAVVKTEELSKLINPDHIGETCLLLATQEADSSFTIRALVNASGAVNAAFAAVYQAEKAQADKQEKDRLEELEAELKAAKLKKAA